MRQVLACTEGMNLVRSLRDGLAEHDINVVMASSHRVCLVQARQMQPDGILLSLPENVTDAGRTVAEFRRESGASMLVIAHTYSETQAIAVLDAGADDYVVHRNNDHELNARVRALLRRSARISGQRSVTIGDLRIDAESRTVRIQNREARLTPLEFRLLSCLAANVGKSLSPGTLLRAVQGYDLDEGDAAHIIKALVWRLRQKIETDPANPRYILNVRGSGYILERRGPNRRTSSLPAYRQAS